MRSARRLASAEDAARRGISGIPGLRPASVTGASVANRNHRPGAARRGYKGFPESVKPVEKRTMPSVCGAVILSGIPVLLTRHLPHLYDSPARRCAVRSCGGCARFVAPFGPVTGPTREPGTDGCFRFRPLRVACRADAGTGDHESFLGIGSVGLGSTGWPGGPAAVTAPALFWSSAVVSWS
jgi:hypothetical protein